MQTFSRRVAAVLFVWLTAVSTAAWCTLPASAGGKDLPSLAPMLDKITPAVVNVATQGHVKLRNPLFADPFFRRFFNVPNQPIERKFQSLGSGVIVDAKRGLILTNNHVVANADQITVGLHDGRHVDATIVGTDPETDVAVIKVKADNLQQVPTADSDKLRVGDFVVAIGNPFGLGQTVTSGIVSALGRSGLGIEGYEDFIQTDASINPGNSGGALVNLDGQLVGINTAIFSQSGGNIGIGFAIPINMALQVMEQIVKTGKVDRGYIGVEVQDLNPDLAEAFNIKVENGAVINSVLDGSPADKAGLKTGDVIVSINDKPVHGAGDVRNQVGLMPVGTGVKFSILRDGKPNTITVKVGSRKEMAGTPGSRNERLSGVTVGDIGPDNPYYGHVEGVVVSEVQQDSHAWNSGLRKGDIITSVNHLQVADLKSFLALVDKSKGALLLRIIRGDAAAFLVIK